MTVLEGFPKISFNVCPPFLVFDKIKAVPRKISTGTIYAKNPNIPKRKAENKPLFYLPIQIYQFQ
jgi:hypothetical protein